MFYWNNLAKTNIKITVIVDRASHNDEHTDLFNKLFGLYRTPLVGFAQSYLKNRADAEDLVHDVFAMIWDTISDVDSCRNIRSLLFTVTKNRCVSVLRNRVKYIDHSMSSSELRSKIEQIALEYSTIEEIETEELQAQIDNIMGTLPDDYREIFLLNREHGKSYSNIAEKRGISVKTVEKKMSATLRIFRSKLREF